MSDFEEETGYHVLGAPTKTTKTTRRTTRPSTAAQKKKKHPYHAAKGAAVRWSWLPRAAGRAISGLGTARSCYGFIIIPAPEKELPHGRVGLFQTKQHFKDDASLRLIRASCDALMEWVETTTALPGWPLVAVNYPGIGNGNLDRREVEPVIARMLRSPLVEVYARAGER